MPSQCTVSSALLVSGTSANCFCKETWTGPLKLQQSVCPNLLLTYSSLNPNVLLNLKLEYHWRCLIHCELKRQSFVNVLIQKKIIILLNFKEESIYGKITKGALTLKPLKEIGERKSWIHQKETCLVSSQQAEHTSNLHYSATHLADFPLVSKCKDLRAFKLF